MKQSKKLGWLPSLLQNPGFLPIGVHRCGSVLGIRIHWSSPCHVGGVRRSMFPWFHGPWSVVPWSFRNPKSDLPNRLVPLTLSKTF